MDPDSSSFSPLPSTSSSALDARFGRLSLSRPSAATGFLQDEDMSFALAGGDDSFDFAHTDGGEDTVRLASGPAPPAAGGGGEQHDGGKGKAPQREDDLFFGGSMATASAVPASRRFAPSVPQSTDAEEDGDGDEEMDPEAYSEEERARIRSLRGERDGLRGMNAVLEGMKGALAGMEGKMQAFESTIATSHALLDLYTRIASQAEHTKDLLLDREWEGVQHDYDHLAAREAAHAAALEREAHEAALAAQRAEEARARAEREEEDRRRREEEAVRAPGRGRGRGLRGAPSSSNLRGPRGSTLVRGGAPRPSPPSSSSSSGIPTRGSAVVSGVRGVRGLRSRVGTAGARGGRGTGATE
ncbi:hypothetical protein JCM3770_005648 [Rhodotorula araucariae]